MREQTAVGFYLNSTFNFDFVMSSFDLTAELERARRNAFAWQRRLEELELQQRRQQQPPQPQKKARGRSGGRKPILNADQLQTAIDLLEQLPLSSVAQKLGVHKKTIVRALSKHEQTACPL